MPAADSRAWLAKLRPPSTKISAWYSRLAPPLSTRWIIGSLLSRAISCARSALRRPIGGTVPPLTALSLAAITQRLPATTPMPTMEPPPSTAFLPSSSCMPRPASGLSSRNTEPRSISRATRSRGSNCPRSSKRARLLSDSATTCACSACTSARRSAMRCALARKAAEFVSRVLVSAGMSLQHFRRHRTMKPVEGLAVRVLRARPQRARERRATIDLHRDAGDEGRRGAQQETDQRTDLGFEAQPMQRHVLLHARDDLLELSAVGV